MTTWIDALMPHLVVAPILLPLAAAAVMLLLGDIHLASALFFDLGVFAVVLGSTLLVLTALAHQSVRGRRPTPDAGAPEAG